MTPEAIVGTGPDAKRKTLEGRWASLAAKAPSTGSGGSIRAAASRSSRVMRDRPIHVSVPPRPVPIENAAPMIPRYTRPRMAAVWEPDNRFRIMLEVETLAAEAMEELGAIPAGVSAALRARGAFDAGRIDEIERETRHDVVAFLTDVAERVGEEARFMHRGMTSSDVLDTCLAVQLAQACDILIEDTDALLEALARRAREHALTPCVGRSHGVHAEPTTFGLKLAGFHAEFRRARRRLVAARGEIATCAISGPVGTFATVDPRVEAHVAGKLGLEAEPVSTQVIPRDRHAAFFAALAVTASSVERLAVEIRHLQRTEVREAEEAFAEGQKGSSAMPHKRNPVLTENLTGLARLVRSAAVPALENVALWHERDISHSSVERNIGPDATTGLDFALARLTNVIDGLVVYPEAMKANLDRLDGLVFSQRVLLALTQAGMDREAAYRLVQAHAMAAWREGGGFEARLKADREISETLAGDGIERLFDYGFYTKHAEAVIERALNAPA